MPENIFEGIIGHRAIIRILEAAMRDPASSYLLTGPAHLGKRTCAERLTRGLLDLDPDDPSWRAHPDLLVIEPLEGKTQITVEQIRDARERLSLRPARAPRSVAYIPAADRMNEAGTNALLKIVEEPPAGAVFVFVAEDAGRIPGTLKSRSVVLPYAPVAAAEIEEGLIACGMTKEDALARAAGAHGRPGLAIDPPEGRSVGATFVQAFFRASTPGARITAVDALAASCDGAEEPVAAWRDALQDAMRRLSAQYPKEPAHAVIAGIALATAFRSIGGAVSPRLALDAVAVRLDEPDLSRFMPCHVPRAYSAIYSL